MPKNERLKSSNNRLDLLSRLQVNVESLEGDDALESNNRLDLLSRLQVRDYALLMLLWSVTIGLTC